MKLNAETPGYYLTPYLIPLNLTTSKEPLRWQIAAKGRDLEAREDTGRRIKSGRNIMCQVKVRLGCEL
jgi:hypothetical protein